MAADAFGSAMWTRQAGWGMNEKGAGAGASGDAAGRAEATFPGYGQGPSVRRSAGGYHGKRSIERKPAGGRGEQWV